MVREQIEARGIIDPLVLEALRVVPRGEFCLEERGDPHGDHALAIACGQTISQPYIVALMTEAVGVCPESRILEVGTGSGYQAAVLAEIAAEVFSLERIPQLAREGEARLQRLGYDNVRVRVADGYAGWASEGPFDGIVVTCAAAEIPGPLIKQLRVGARLIVPVGPVGGDQELLLITRGAGEAVTCKTLCGVRFVPLVRERPAGEGPTRPQ